MDPHSLQATVVGAGAMGHGIAHVLARAGTAVTVYDVDRDALGRVRERIAADARALGDDPRVAERVACEQDLERAVAAADWVFEAAPERLALKQELFARMDAVAPPACVLATNTSVLRVGEVGAHVTHGERVVGTHWWNPSQLVPLVEVIGAASTAPEVVERTIALLRALGKTPVHVRRDMAGSMWSPLFRGISADDLAVFEKEYLPKDQNADNTDSPIVLYKSPK